MKAARKKDRVTHETKSSEQQQTYKQKEEMEWYILNSIRQQFPTQITTYYSIITLNVNELKYLIKNHRLV